VYEFSPYGLIWCNDRYYAAGYSRHHGKVITFRVDRIAVPKLTDYPAVSKPDGFDMAVYANTIIQMYDGPQRDITLLCKNKHMKTIIDFFSEVKTTIVDN
jgi:predicted DNA-binding transcriptional regulator YafY